MDDKDIIKKEISRLQDLMKSYIENGEMEKAEIIKAKIQIIENELNRRG